MSPSNIDIRTFSSVYGLIGKSLQHSHSPRMVNQWFGSAGLDAIYTLFEMEDLTGLPDLIDGLPDLKGFNVTIPYKTSIMPLLDMLTPEARRTGAVNTVKITRTPSGRVLTGHNTDVEGFREAMFEICPCFPQGTGAMVLGTGGASKAVITALRDLGIGDIIKVSRRQGPHADADYASLTPDAVASRKIIVNATPLGTFPDVNSFPSLPYEAIRPETICFDLVYNPPMTMFMQKCAHSGATTCNGLRMLELQARASLDFWNINLKTINS